MNKISKDDNIIENGVEIDLGSKHEVLNDYKIINFLKKEPSILITIITSVITLITVVLSFVANSIQKQYLLYWNISAEFIRFNTTNLMYQLGISIVISLSAIFFITLINIFYAKYFGGKIYKIQVRYACKECERHYKSLARKRWFASCICIFLDKTSFLAFFKFWSKLLDKNGESLRQITESLETLKLKIKNAKNISANPKEFLLLKLVIELLALTLVMFFVFLFFNMFVVNDGSYIKATVYMTVVVVTLYSLLGYLTARKKVPRAEIKEMVHQYLSGEVEWKNFEYKNEYNKQNIKEFFTDDVLKRSFTTLSLFLICFIIGLSVSLSRNPEEQKNFYTVKYQEEVYVVLHAYDDNLVLEKAEETLDSKNNKRQIEIDTSCQTIIAIDGATVKYSEYDVVIQKND